MRLAGWMDAMSSFAFVICPSGECYQYDDMIVKEYRRINWKYAEADDGGEGNEGNEGNDAHCTCIPI